MIFNRSVCYMILLMLVAYSVMGQPSQLSLSVHAEAAILMNADTGVILYEKKIHAPHYPASITKIATATYLLQQTSYDLNAMITADQDCVGTVTEEAMRRSQYTLPAYSLIPDASSFGIKRGETLSLRDLLYGMMMASGDDAANVIAKHAGGTIPQFMNEVNVYLKELGCRNTVLYNPHGLHHPNQVTTAYDMAILTRKALENEVFREIVRTVSYKRPKTNKQEAFNIVQGNRLLRPGPYYYEKAIGVKTGYYSLASSTFVAAATDGDRTLIAVLLKTRDRKDIFKDSKMMFETAFNQPKVQRVMLKEGSQKFILELACANRTIPTFLKNDVTVDYYPAEEPTFQCVLVWDKNLQLPITKGSQLGNIVVQSNTGQIFNTVPLFAEEPAELTRLAKFQDIFKTDRLSKRTFKMIGGGLILLFLSFLALQLRSKK